MTNPSTVLHCFPGLPAFLLFVGLMFGGCSPSSAPANDASSETQSPSTAEPAARLEGGYDSLEELAQAILLALAANDDTAFQQTRISESEYHEIVYANLPEKEKSWKTADAGWARIDQDCDKVIGRYLSAKGGNTYRLLAVRHTGTLRDLGAIQILAQVIIDVENPNYKLEEWPLMNRVVLMHGKYKVIAYDD